MSEAEALARIALRAGGLRSCRLFRNTVGTGWQGSRVPDTRHGVVALLNPRFVTFGLTPDSPDLVGWRSVVVTNEMVGATVAQFVGGEVKTRTGKLSDGQRRFLRALRDAGGFASVWRDDPDAAAAEILSHSMHPGRLE